MQLAADNFLPMLIQPLDKRENIFQVILIMHKQINPWNWKVNWHITTVY